jgi:murein DD-endopeptidase MepM/ murein hydrolase activator NlpD
MIGTPAPKPQPDAAALRAQVAQLESRVAAKAQALDERQAFLDALASARYKATEAELRRLGLKPSRFHGQGGPFEALLGDKAPVKEGDPQFRALFLSWKKLDQLEQGVIAIPSAKPVSSANFTSGFGVRSDPFRGAAAMHAGIDLAGPIGTPIHATADGVVGRAEWANGYGNLVELEHGKGIATRYGHLSKILVKPNTRVKRGDVIALMGSTGRSTGSHLHYEVRIDGRAVNPVPFLQSSDYLLAVQRRAEATQVALGGPDN